VVLRKYVIYGLGIHSEIPLWGDGVSDCRRDIVVSWERTAGKPAGEVGDDPRRRGTRDEILLAWPSICEMSVRGGDEIVVRAVADSDVSHLRHLVSGIGLGLALYQRGLFTLHAGAVVIGGTAVAIAGPKGAGKSTLVSALVARGHLLLSDDVVALDLSDDAPPLVRVGASNVNLWPDSAVATGHDPSTFSQIWSQSPKLAGSVPRVERPEPAPLGAVVILSQQEGAPPLERLSPVDAFAQLVGHSHAFRWIAEPTGLPRHMLQCRKLLASVPVFRLQPGESLSELPTLARRIEECVLSTWDDPAMERSTVGCP
jgi:hypothetical protein